MTQSQEEPIDGPARPDGSREADGGARPATARASPAARLVGLGLALIVVVVVLFAFDRFLASMQRFLGLPVVDPEPSVTEPLPAYAVPADQDSSGEAVRPDAPRQAESK